MLGVAEDRDAVARACESGQLAGYAGDVWFPQPAPQDHPWRSMPHHGMTPHTSGTSLSAPAAPAAPAAAVHSSRALTAQARAASNTPCAAARAAPNQTGAGRYQPDRRVEAVVPVGDPKLRQRLQQILDVSLADDVLAWELRPDGGWRRVPTVRGLNSHNRFKELALESAHGNGVSYISNA